MEIQEQKSDLVQIDEDRLNELMEISKQLYPEIDPFFIHMVCVEQVMHENGYEFNEDEYKEMYNKAQEENKNKEYYFNVE
jgi:hypothetical protein